ncbi:MAG: Plug domain-containing protein [Nitrospira sp. CG24C]|nr:Plug domain-containing protein [Nitrospira sp.]THJ12423.1 MAG: Plug domain-containing protein [Nitrospira sp. CG24C]
MMLDQGLTMVRAAIVFGLLGMAAPPVWSEEKQVMMNEQERTARIKELQRERTKVEDELRRLRLQPEGTARSTVPRSEFSNQPTRSMKESLESVPGVSARPGSSGRDMQFSIRGSK